MLPREATQIADCYWQYIGEFLSTRRPLEEIDSTESSVWIQTGLALTPFAGCVTQHTCDWTIAWSLVGEWTSQEIFLPPAGDWPRNGHSMNLVEDFDYRRPCLLTWARACFEQGSLPSMLHLGGSALLGVLPEDVPSPAVESSLYSTGHFAWIWWSQTGYSSHPARPS